MKRGICIAAFAGVLFSYAFAPTLHAAVSTLIVSISGSNRAGANGFTLGGSFTVGGTSVQVNALGVYDGTGNGLTTATPVGIWAGNGASDAGLDPLIASGTVPVGTSPSLISQFRYVTLGSPVVLQSGSTYTIGAYYSSSDTDPMIDHGQTMTLNGDFTAVSAEFTASNTLGSLHEPNGQTSNGFYGGPNFQFSTVPEPGSFALLSAGGIGLIVARRRLNRR